jgi:hypothetical protein
MRFRKRPAGVFDTLADAESAAGGRLTLGVCPMRCSPMPYLNPIAMAWTGGALAASKVCLHCFDPLVRTSRHTWAGLIRVL